MPPPGSRSTSRSASGPRDHQTIGRLLAAREPGSLGALLHEVAERRGGPAAAADGGAEAPAPPRHLAVDGEVVAGSVTKREAQRARADGGRAARLTANVYDVARDVTIATAGITGAAGADGRAPAEHALVEGLLAGLDPAGAEITVGAGHARRVVTDLVDATASAAWTMSVEGNNAATRDAIAAAFARADAPMRRDADVTYDRARGDTRYVRVLGLATVGTSPAQSLVSWTSGGRCGSVCPGLRAAR